MASKDIFGSKGSSSSFPVATAINAAGGRAYNLEAKEALAQLAVTGCFNQTFYASAADQLDKVKSLLGAVDPDFVGKLAVYSRERGFMKDMPAFLLGYLTGLQARMAKGEDDARKAGKAEEAAAMSGHVREMSAMLLDIFPRVIDNGKMLRNFVQIIRSGQSGRKSFGSAPKRLIRAWFDTRTEEQVFYASVGNDPSLADVIRLCRPVPMTQERAALYGYLLGREKGKFNDAEFEVTQALPEVVQTYEAFRKAPLGALPKAPYEMLEGLSLTESQWKELAMRSSWQQLRQHLNTFQKKGVFKDQAVVKALADKLRDKELIQRAKAMPYQLMVAFKNVSGETPLEITNALQDAMEIATMNIPVIDGVIAVLPDVSGSMHSAITGTRINPKTGKAESHTSKVQCLDVAALVAAAVMRRNPQTVVIPFEARAIKVKLNPKDSIMTNAEILSRLPAGGTNCAAALAEVNARGLNPALCWFVSDNESWIESARHGAWGGGATQTMGEWDKIVRKNPNAKLVCMDLTPNTTTQAPSRKDILNVGGFSDAVFDVVATFCSGYAQSWVEMIENYDSSTKAAE